LPAGLEALIHADLFPELAGCTRLAAGARGLLGAGHRGAVRGGPCAAGAAQAREALAGAVEDTDGATIRADLHVERDSQKGIVIGKGGRQLTRIGRTARKGIERLLGGHVYLDLRVKVAKNWQRDPKKMGRLGF